MYGQNELSAWTARKINPVAKGTQKNTKHRQAVAGPSDERAQQGIENDWVCVGVFGGPHGVRGDIRLKSFAGEPEAIFSFPNVCIGASGKSVSLKKVREVKDSFVARVKDVTSPEDAALLKGKRLFVERSSLAEPEEDEFYLADLIALDVLDENGGKLGFIRAVENFGSEDLLEVVLDAPVKGLGRFAFIPFRKALVPTVDIAGGHVTVAWQDWLATQVSENAADESDNATDMSQSETETVADEGAGS